MIMSRILFSLACTAIISILTKFVKIIFKKFISLTQTAPARVSFAFHSAKSHVPSNYRSRKSCAVAVRRKQKRLCLKTRKRRNWLGLVGVAHPRRIRRSLASPRQAPKCVLFILYSTHYVMICSKCSILPSHSLLESAHSFSSVSTSAFIGKFFL